MALIISDLQYMALTRDMHRHFLKALGDRLAEPAIRARWALEVSADASADERSGEVEELIRQAGTLGYSEPDHVQAYVILQAIATPVLRSHPVWGWISSIMGAKADSPSARMAAVAALLPDEESSLCFGPRAEHRSEAAWRER